METSDRGSCLSDIARQQGRSIISALVDIQDVPDTIEPRTLRFIENLRCLRVPQYPRCDRELAAAEVRVERETIDATQVLRPKYVALSYTWDPSRHENESSGSYLVQERHSRSFNPSNVRNCVLDRIFNYARTVGVEYIWIDQHSIVQDNPSCDPACAQHAACIERREGVTVMDLVYKLSGYPVGLLGRPITSAWELKPLANLLQGKLTSGVGSKVRLSRKRSEREVWMAVEVLHRITDDDWWRRGWTFQESYKSGTRMRLLIKHPSKLKRLKRHYWIEDKRTHYRNPIFGNVDGELCISYVDFLEEATRLCLGCLNRINRHRGPSAPTWMLEMKYTYILERSQPMTPQIITDIDKRQMKYSWDMLTITANCCGYAVRLNKHQLKQNNASLSLSILAQCLLNGEVLQNGHPPTRPISNLTFTNNTSQSLTLSYLGIHTYGHMWNLGKVIDTRNWPASGAYRRRLAYLIGISNYLDRDAGLAGYMHTMAEEIAEAIKRRDQLMLGCLWDPGYHRPYMAVFVWGAQDAVPQTLAFTASRPEHVTDEFDLNDLDRHVTFEVGVEDQNSRVPRLRIRRWLPGMCFFRGVFREEVVFPWPSDLKGIAP
ncbi:hypothetical protein C8A03DRAFT_48273 [Achaetomium macrosporum]|uniref:Heterokaryon incompatibility domain-containing protein n=1 Tax=Achaetomium macrosporum TaxID=79813 RepID=A0AAN7C0J7_9PEZI|nr:hypothetical protein C8A03DRAFT_48273 [Achaetomium macrosporum]